MAKNVKSAQELQACQPRPICVCLMQSCTNASDFALAFSMLSRKELNIVFWPEIFVMCDVTASLNNALIVSLQILG